MVALAVLCVVAGHAANNLPFRPCGLVDGLGHVERLREAGPVQPRDAVADLESGVLDGGGEAVPGAGAAEREHVPARLEDTQALTRPRLAPLLEQCGCPVLVRGWGRTAEHALAAHVGRAEGAAAAGRPVPLAAHG